MAIVHIVLFEFKTTTNEEQVQDVSISSILTVACVVSDLYIGMSAHASIA